jgi:hypothetical protein
MNGLLSSNMYSSWNKWALWFFTHEWLFPLWLEFKMHHTQSHCITRSENSPRAQGEMDFPHSVLFLHWTSGKGLTLKVSATSVDPPSLLYSPQHPLLQSYKKKGTCIQQSQVSLGCGAGVMHGHSPSQLSAPRSPSKRERRSPSKQREKLGRPSPQPRPASVCRGLSSPCPAQVLADSVLCQLREDLLNSRSPWSQGSLQGTRSQLSAFWPRKSPRLRF